MGSYIMQGEGEPGRIRFKTEAILTRHHLDWAGLRPGQSFVDFGCASGEVAREAARIASPARVVGVDGDPEMLAFAKTESDRLGLANASYQHAWIGPEPTPLPGRAFDHAWTRYFLEYQRDPLAVVREMARVVKPGGRVTLIDLDGNCIWHHPMRAEFAATLDSVMADLATTGFDPRIGVKLRGLAERAGLADLREAIEPYHRIVGAPDAHTAEAWRRKVEGIKKNYLEKLFPEKADRAAFFDEFLDLILAEDTMTWSVLYLVQGTVPA